ncbi:MAG: hypothetical protein Fur0025_00030 [Oscillatoriaceae cyanobacterium]
MTGQIPDQLPPEPQPRYVWVCQHQSCQRQGSEQVLAAFLAADLPEGVTIIPSGCLGQCSTGPTVRVTPEETWYYRVQPADVPVIVEQHLKQGTPVKHKLNPRIHLSFVIGN